MKALSQKLMYSLAAIVISASFMAVLSPVDAGAQASQGDTNHCNHYFLTFPAWYNGVNEASKDAASGELTCSIASPTKMDGGFSTFMWRIVLNIVEIMLNVVGYASVVFIIYGGYKYLYSAGSPNGMMGARKTIMNAVVGLILSIMSIAIVNTIAGSFK
jgi:hypothetical protein